MKTIQEIDSIKLQIESKYIPPLNKIFRHMAADARALYLKTKRIPVQSLSINYNPEFLKVIRDAQREAIKVFGFDIRDNAESKGYCFKTMKYKALIDYHIETKEVDPIMNVDAIEKVNNSFAFEAALFVANSSEEQVAYIDKTNVKEIEEAEKLSVILFFNQKSELQDEIITLEQELRKTEFDVLFSESRAIADAKKKRLEEKITVKKKELADLVVNQDKIIADKIQQTLIEKGQVRSPLIASQNVGMAESWARQKEAEKVSEAVPELQLKKRWTAILDSRTRATHITADGQEVGVNEMFLVGGYNAKTPRSENLPPEESINCRCVAIYFSE